MTIKDNVNELLIKVASLERGDYIISFNYGYTSKIQLHSFGRKTSLPGLFYLQDELKLGWGKYTNIRY